MSVRSRSATAILCAAAVVWLQAGLSASPQDPADPAVPSVSRLKQRLARAPANLKPSEPVQLRPVYRSRSVNRPFVPTLEEHLHETFDLTDFQRKYAEYAAVAGGIDLGVLFRKMERALDERRERKVREEVSRELAFVEAAQARQIR